MLRQTITDQSGNVTTNTYDQLDRLTEALTKTPGGSTISDYRYALDGNGNLLKQTTTSAATSYAYNGDNQACWSYTGASSNTCASPPSGAYNESYDLDGNLTSNGNGLTLTYNALNQTAAIDGTADGYYGQSQDERISAGGATFQNDILGLSRRSESGQSLYLTRDPTGQLIDQRGTSNYYPLVDGEGTIIALTDSNGHLANTYTYDPNGNRTSATGGAPSYLGFQGGYQTDGNLYHYGARYYNPNSTTFTQPDPLQTTQDFLSKTGDLRQADRYLYAGDDPINASDPFGLCTAYQYLKAGGGCPLHGESLRQVFDPVYHLAQDCAAGASDSDPTPEDKGDSSSFGGDCEDLGRSGR